jgi:8-oxo-dGTP pyrophosphatase MutT (NUDIX family)
VRREAAALTAAQGELAEETGYTVERWTPLGHVRPSAAFYGGLRKSGASHRQSPRLLSTQEP